MMTELQDVRARRAAARSDAHRRRAGRRRPRRSRSAIPYTGERRRHRAQGHGRRRPARLRHRASAYKPKLTRYERYRDPAASAAELIRSRADAISDLITAECGPLQEGLALRSRPRLRRVPVRRQRGAEGRRPGLLLRPHAARQDAQGLHAARAAARRDLRDHAVQPPAEPGRAQGRAVDRHQQPDGAEAHREDAALRARCSPTSCTRPGLPPQMLSVVTGDPREIADEMLDQPGRRPRHLHRRRADRQVHRREGRLQAAGARARRQRPDHRDGGRRPRRSRDARRRRLVQELRASAARRSSACSCTRRVADALRRAAGREDEGVDVRRSDGSDASTWAR